MDYLQNPVLLSLLPYFAVELSSAMRVALLGLAAGFHPRELSVLPGLKQAKRLRVTLSELENKGRIVRTDAGYLCVPASPLHKTEVLDLLKRHSKLRRTLDMLEEPLTRLRARGLGKVGAELEPEERGALLAALQDAEVRVAADRSFRKRARAPLLQFVSRRVPREHSRLTPEGPRPPRAPAGLLARSQRLMPENEERLSRLYNALVPYGESALDHWWRILQAYVARGLRGQELWDAWRTRLESYILRRRFPLSSGVRLQGVDARELKARYPVPEEGYGYWVDEELDLWRRFRGRFEPALGYLFTRTLWTQSHETVPAILRMQHGGAHASLVSEEQYEDCLFRAAEACSGLSDLVLEHLRRGLRTAAVRAARANAEREALELAVRAALAKAAKLAADNRNVVTEKDEADRSWAVNFLIAVARRGTAKALSTAEFKALLEKAGSAGARGGRRFRWPKLAEQVRRELDASFHHSPVIIGPREPFPSEAVWERVRFYASEIMASGVTINEREAALQGLCDYVEHRGCIDIVYEDGTVERQSIRDAIAMAGSDGMAYAFVSSMVQRVRRMAYRPQCRRAA